MIFDQIENEGQSSNEDELQNVKSDDVGKEKPTNTYMLQKFNITCNDLDYCLIQLIDMTKSQMYDQALLDKEFAGMINATVSHEMRGPINSIQLNVVEHDTQMHQLKQAKDEIHKIVD